MLVLLRILLTVPVQIWKLKLQFNGGNYESGLTLSINKKQTCF
jgi:hypothetical protein